MGGDLDGGRRPQWWEETLMVGGGLDDLDGGRRP